MIYLALTVLAAAVGIKWLTFRVRHDPRFDGGTRAFGLGSSAASFAGFFASRRNYDIARGVDARGRACSGVLEQSWRIGGASSAEIAALEAFRSGARLVRASTLELFGPEQVAPPGACVLFRGEDPELGYLTKCVVTTELDSGIQQPVQR